MQIYSAPWLVPINGPGASSLRDGSLAVSNKGRIVAVGPRAEICAAFPGAPEHRCRTVLMPGLVNGHAHLELAPFGLVDTSDGVRTLPTWIRALLATRFGSALSAAELDELVIDFIQHQRDSGVVLVGDIGNEPLSTDVLTAIDSCGITCLHMLELLGANKDATQSALKRLDDIEESKPVTAHAPYSTSPRLLQAIKKRCTRLNHLFSLHLAESPEEVELICKGGGIFRDFLEERGVWDGSLPFTNGNVTSSTPENYSSPIQYIDRLGLLDSSSLLVHCVQASKEDLQLIAARGAHICLCPGSNRYLGVGDPPLVDMLQCGILPALGTDSSASNPQPDIWEEMKILAHRWPQVECSAILTMATQGGAAALGLAEDFGSLAAGRRAQFLVADSKELRLCEEEHTLMAQLVRGGRPESLQRIG